ncbi:MAG: PucR family transcriptional regulator [Oscillospiraceae bacterium]|jgi:hypothetical protein
MYLHFRKLADELKKICNTREFNVSPQTIIRDIALFPAPQRGVKSSANNETAYVIDYYQLQYIDQVKDMPPLICSVKSGEEIDESYFTYLRAIVALNVGVTDLLVCIARVISDCGVKTSRIAEAASAFLACKTPDELIRVGFQFLANPIVVTDANQTIILNSPESCTSNSHYAVVLSQKTLPIGHPIPNHFDAQPSDGGSVQLIAPEGEMPAVIVKEITQGDRFLGALHIFQINRSFLDDDMYIASFLGDMMAIAFPRAVDKIKKSQKEEYTTFFRDLLSGKLSGIENITNRIKDSGIRLPPWLTVLNLMRRGPTNIKYFPIASYAADLASSIPECYSFFYNKSALIIVGSNDPKLDCSDIFEHAKDWMDKGNIVVGISNSFSHVEKLRRYFAQSAKALELGVMLNKPGSVFYYRNLAIYHIIEQSIGSYGYEMPVAPELIPLIEHCRKEGPQLLETLEAYLNAGCSVKKTADITFTHINTVRYRLDRIKDLIPMDLSDGETITRLKLSLKALEYYQIKHNIK